MTRWWVRRGENTFGPLETPTIVEALRDGRIEPGDLACREGAREWMIVTSIPEVAETFAPKRSQPPPEQDPWTEAAWMVGDLDGEILAGPLSLEEVKRDVASGQIPGGALLARVGSSAWRPMSDIFEEEMKTGVRQNPLTVLQQMQLQQALQQQMQPSPQRPPQQPTQPPQQPPPTTRVGTPLPVARQSAAPPPPSKPPGPPPPRRRTQVIVGAQNEAQPPPNVSAPVANVGAQRPSAPPRAPNVGAASGSVAPPPMVPRPATQPPPLPPRARNRRTLLEGVQVPDASEQTMSPSDGLEWWVSREGTPVGPLTTEQVREGLSHGAIDAQTNVCRGDQQQWRPAATFTELTGSASSARNRPPPLPPKR